MSRVPETGSTDPLQIIADLRRANAELQQKLDQRTAELQTRTAERDDLERQLAAAAEQQTATAEILQIIKGVSAW